MAEHDGGGTAQPQPMRGTHHRLPFFRIHLIGADDGPYFIIQNLGCRARQSAKPSITQPRQKRR